MDLLIDNNHNKIVMDEKKENIQKEFMQFLKTNTVYETIPENMKVS